MLKIGEFSKLVRVSARMLRHYEQCGLLKPAEIDKFTGYRMYSAAQIPMLFHIVELRDMGFSIDEMLEILPRMNDAAYMRRMLAARSDKVTAAIAAEEGKLARISALSSKIDKEDLFMVYDVELKSLPAVQVMSLRGFVPAPEAESMLWDKIGEIVEASNATRGKGGYSLYHDEEYRETDVDIEVCIPVQVIDGTEEIPILKELPAIPHAATVRFSGSYTAYGKAMEKLMTWIETNGYAIDGDTRGHGVVLPDECASEEELLTELQVPVRKI